MEGEAGCPVLLSESPEMDSEVWFFPRNGDHEHACEKPAEPPAFKHRPLKGQKSGCWPGHADGRTEGGGGGGKQDHLS